MPRAGLTASIVTVLSVLAMAALTTVTGLAAIVGGAGMAYSDLPFQTFTAANDLSSKYQVYAAEVSQDHAAAVVLQFHGDGAYEFANPNLVVQPRRSVGHRGARPLAWFHHCPGTAPRTPRARSRGGNGAGTGTATCNNLHFATGNSEQVQQGDQDPALASTECTRALSPERSATSFAL